MRTHAPLLRLCFFVLLGLLLVAVFSFLYRPDQGRNLWSILFPSWDIFLQRGPSLPITLLLAGALVSPPLASWSAWKYPTRLISLVGLWIALTLNLTAFLIFLSSLEVILLPHTSDGSVLHTILVSLLPRIVFLIPGLSALLCFMLALSLPLLRSPEQSARRTRQPDAEETPPERVPRARRQDSGRLLALGGLLCHLLIAGSLLLPYIDFSSPYSDTIGPTVSTGWQLLTQAFQPAGRLRPSLMPPLPLALALVLLITLLLPALLYLLSLTLWPLRNARLDAGLRGSLYIGYVLILVGLSLSAYLFLLSMFSSGGDPRSAVQHTFIAFAIPPLAFLGALSCCTLLLRRFQLPPALLLPDRVPMDR